LETVDGGSLEDVTITNITMRDVTTSPIFLRLGRRMRGPAGTTVGKLRRVIISDVIAYNAEPRYASIIAGLPDYHIEDVSLNNIRIFYRGGAKKELADLQPPERETNYPEPSMFGEMPVYGLFVRHVKNISVTDVEISYLSDDFRPPFWLEDVNGAVFGHVAAQKMDSVPTFVLRSISDFTTQECRGVANMHLERVDQKKL